MQNPESGLYQTGAEDINALQKAVPNEVRF